MISITKSASDKLKEIADAEGIGHTSIRVKVIGGGCAGFTHDMTYDNNPTEFDETVEIDGIMVIVDPLSFQYLENVEIDWVSQGFSEGFKFRSPDSKSSCGCGNSVSY